MRLAWRRSVRHDATKRPRRNCWASKPRALVLADQQKQREKSKQADRQVDRQTDRQTVRQNTTNRMKSKNNPCVTPQSTFQARFFFLFSFSFLSVSGTHLFHVAAAKVLGLGANAYACMSLQSGTLGYLEPSGSYIGPSWALRLDHPGSAISLKAGEFAHGLEMFGEAGGGSIQICMTSYWGAVERGTHCPPGKCWLY